MQTSGRGMEWNLRLKWLEMFSAAPRVSLTLPSSSPNYPRDPKLDGRTQDIVHSLIRLQEHYKERKNLTGPSVSKQQRTKTMHTCSIRVNFV